MEIHTHVCKTHLVKSIYYSFHGIENIEFIPFLKDFKIALEGVPSINNITKKQIDYVMKVLALDEHCKVTFRMFGVSVALCERITKME